MRTGENKNLFITKITRKDLNQLAFRYTQPHLCQPVLVSYLYDGAEILNSVQKLTNRN